MILIGHSMGGILATEVALIPADSPNSKFRHRVLGTINFDTPFLGMHPGVVISGIGSLFKPAAAELKSENPIESSSLASVGLPNSQSSTTLDSFSPTSPTPSLYTTNSQSLLNPETSEEPGAITTLPTGSQHSVAPSCLGSSAASITDPNYNPPFPNDVRLPTRTGWNNAVHFLMKHSDGLTTATKSYVTSHLEFGGALADYKGLQKRYQKLRALEDARPPEHRIRFVNYYTASTGRPSQPKKPASLPLDGAESASEAGSKPTEEVTIEAEEPEAGQPPESPNQKTENTEDSERELDSESPEHEASNLNTLDPSPLTDSETDAHSFRSADETIDASPPNTSTPPPPTNAPITRAPTLPSLPPLPTEPPPFDPAPYPAKDVRKLAERDHARLVKTYQSALKERDRAIKDRRKLLEKRAKEAEKALVREEKLRLKEEREMLKREGRDGSAALGGGTREGNAGKWEGEKGKVKAKVKGEKVPRDKKFCMLPPKVQGRVDGCWERVFMEGVDEVGAHCGLFFVGAHYEGLVEDVGKRVEGWVREAEAVGV